MDEEYIRNIILVDVSCFMFLEATGDSELDSNSYSTGPVDSHHHIRLVDDDAESCSSECGSSSHQNVRINGEDLPMDLDVDDGSGDGDGDGNADNDDATSLSCCLHVDNENTRVYNSEEDDKDVVEQRWNIGYDGVRCKKSKASNCVDLVTEKLKNQKDDDRLFWESCLAS